MSAILVILPKLTEIFKLIYNALRSRMGPRASPAVICISLEHLSCL